MDNNRILFSCGSKVTGNIYLAIYTTRHGLRNGKAYVNATYEKKGFLFNIEVGIEYLKALQNNIKNCIKEKGKKEAKFYETKARFLSNISVGINFFCDYDLDPVCQIRRVEANEAENIICTQGFEKMDLGEAEKLINNIDLVIEQLK